MSDRPDEPDDDLDEPDPDHAPPWGIWGGLTERERRKLKRRAHGRARVREESIEFLSEDDMYALIDAELGQRQIRDHGLLLTAIARPQVTVFGEPAYPGLSQKAAALMHSLVTSHPLVDGDKRIGLAAALLFYALNGVRLVATDDVLFDLTMAIAEGRLSDVQAIAESLERWESPDRPGDPL